MFVYLIILSVYGVFGGAASGVACPLLFYFCKIKSRAFVGRTIPVIAGRSIEEKKNTIRFRLRLKVDEGELNKTNVKETKV